MYLVFIWKIAVLTDFMLISTIFQMKVDPRSYERNYMQLRKEAWLQQDPVEVLNFFQASLRNCI